MKSTVTFSYFHSRVYNGCNKLSGLWCLALFVWRCTSNSHDRCMCHNVHHTNNISIFSMQTSPQPTLSHVLGSSSWNLSTNGKHKQSLCLTAWVLLLNLVLILHSRRQNNRLLSGWLEFVSSQIVSLALGNSIHRYSSTQISHFFG